MTVSDNKCTGDFFDFFSLDNHDVVAEPEVSVAANHLPEEYESLEATTYILLGNHHSPVLLFLLLIFNLKSWVLKLASCLHVVLYEYE